MIALDLVYKLKWPLALGIILFLLSVQLQNLSLSTNVSKGFIDFYVPSFQNGILGLLIGTVFVIYRDLKIGTMLDFSKTTKIVIFSAFIIGIAMMTITAGQILPIPEAKATGFSMDRTDEIYLSSVIPAFGEDPVYLVFLPIILLFVIIAAFEKIGIISGEAGERNKILAIMFIVALISGAIFSSAHVQAYGENQDYYLGAFVFGSGQSLVYMTTGYLMPIAHILHNAFIRMGQLYNINFLGLQVVG